MGITNSSLKTINSTKEKTLTPKVFIMKLINRKYIMTKSIIRIQKQQNINSNKIPGTSEAFVKHKFPHFKCTFSKLNTILSDSPCCFEECDSPYKNDHIEVTSKDDTQSESCFNSGTQESRFNEMRSRETKKKKPESRKYQSSKCFADSRISCISVNKTRKKALYIQKVLLRALME